MNSLQRFAWLLLGLLVLVGVAHAPLHADPDNWGDECSQLALCSGTVVLLLAATGPLLLRLHRPCHVRVLVLQIATVIAARFVHGSRGPPA
jgi:hypothetical protein